MAKKQKRFRDIWVNQTELGKAFRLSAVAVGKKLQEVGLRTADKLPSDLAMSGGYCRFSPMKDGTPFYLWNKEKVAACFRDQGLVRLTDTEVEARDMARQLLDLERQAEETGMDKMLYLFVEGISARDYPLIDHYLRELGSSLRLGHGPDADNEPQGGRDKHSR